MKKFFYLLGTLLFIGCVLISCSTNNLAKFKKNISEQSRVLFSGQSNTFYVTVTSGMREEPYTLNGISNKKVDFSVINLSFFEKKSIKTVECQISLDDKVSHHLLEKNPITNSFMFDIERQIEQDCQIIITVLDQSANLKCKSQEFVVDYETAVEKARENFNVELEEILKEKNARFEIFLKLATSKDNFDDNFVWYIILKSNVNICATIVIDTMQEDSISRLNF